MNLEFIANLFGQKVLKLPFLPSTIISELFINSPFFLLISRIKKGLKFQNVSNF